MTMLVTVLFYKADLDGSNRTTFIDLGSTLISSLTSSTTGMLPVELTSFTCKVYKNSVSLNWQTATEVNNYGFNVERKSKTEDLGKDWFC